MNEQDKLPSDSLDAYVNARQAGDSPQTPSTPESQLARDLMDMGASMRLPDDFHSMMMSEFGGTPPFSEDDKTDSSQSQPTRIIPFPHTNTPPAPNRRRREHGGWFPFVAAAAMMAIMVMGIFALSTIQREPPTAGYPILRENRLPVAVGGFMDRASTSTLALMGDTGMTWVAYTLRFSEADAEADLARARSMIDSAHQNGLRVMIRLVGIAPEFTSYGYDYFDIFAEFAGAVAIYGPDAIQIWHHPNVDNLWYVNRMTASDYTEMVQAVSTRIRAVDDEIMLISAAIAPVGSSAFNDPQLADDAYYRNMAWAGIADYIDCIGVTYLEGVVPPDAVTGDPREGVESNQSEAQNEHETRYLPRMLQRAAVPFVDSELPLCLTDLGYLVPQDFEKQITPTYEWAFENTMQEQATWLRDALLVVDAFDLVPVELVMIWHVQYGYNESPMNGYAIIRPDNACPACDSIATLME